MTISLLKIPIDGTNEIKEIRKVVFNGELNIPESHLFDEYDKTCDQFLIKRYFYNFYEKVSNTTTIKKI